MARPSFFSPLGKWRRLFLNAAWLVIILAKVSAAPAATDEHEAFKRFVAQPPIIEEMIVRYRDVAIFDTNSIESVLYFFCRYQSNAFVYRNAPALPDLNKSLILRSNDATGMYGSNHWRVDHGTLKKWTAAFRASTNIPASFGQMDVVEMRRDIDASTAFNLGIPDVPVGTIIWQGDEFTTTTINGHTMTGQLMDGPDGRPSKMKLLRTLRNGNVVKMEVDYQFDGAKSLPPGVPSRFRRMLILPNTNKLAAEMDLVRLTVSPTALPPDKFAADPYIHRNLRYEISVVNGVETVKEIHQERVKRIRTTYTILAGVMVILAVGVASVFIKGRSPLINETPQQTERL